MGPWNPALSDEQLREMPKAELHVHIEGTLEPGMMFQMAARNGMRLRYGSAGEVRDAFDFADLQSFLDLYYEATRVLVYERDFYYLALAYITKAASRACATSRSSSTLRPTPIGVWTLGPRSGAYAVHSSKARGDSASPPT